MKKIVAGTLAVLALGGAAIAGPASAEPHGGWHGGGWRDGGWRDGGWRGDRGVGIVGAGLLGAAIGSAIAAPHPYYAPRAAYYGYAGCASQWRWDPYLGRYVRVAACY